ncbi:hypothetical protein CRG98_012341 [Punica granatum]|uniref:Uncharacterized protein n=1 Tax=Punica granatum TaxID=22663 RepID=A0A2I0KFJ3_PUNGR|nr:hypothetical protein CRG98_012341 [Punica granatum]
MHLEGRSGEFGANSQTCWERERTGVHVGGCADKCAAGWRARGTGAQLCLGTVHPRARASWLLALKKKKPKFLGQGAAALGQPMGPTPKRKSQNEVQVSIGRAFEARSSN